MFSPSLGGCMGGQWTNKLTKFKSLALFQNLPAVTGQHTLSQCLISTPQGLSQSLGEQIVNSPLHIPYTDTPPLPPHSPGTLPLQQQLQAPPWRTAGLMPSSELVVVVGWVWVWHAWGLSRGVHFGYALRVGWCEV